MKYLLLLLVLLGLSGCFPKVRTTTPLVEMEILDAITKKPIVGVLSSEKIRSDEAGILKVPAETELGLAFPASGVYPIERRLALGKEGYVPQVCLCKILTIRPYCDKATIYMEPRANQSALSLEALNVWRERSKGIMGKEPNRYILQGDVDAEVVCKSIEL